MTRSGMFSWVPSSMTFVMVASRSTMSAFCMITFKQFLLTLGRERKKSSNFFLPTSRNCEKPAGTRKKGSTIGGKKQNHGEALFEKNIGNVFRFHPFQCFKKQNRGERYLKIISATSFGSIFFSASRKSFNKKHWIIFVWIHMRSEPILFFIHPHSISWFLLALLDQAFIPRLILYTRRTRVFKSWWNVCCILFLLLQVSPCNGRW